MNKSFTDILSPLKKNVHGVPLSLLLLVGFWCAMFALYGFTLTTFTVFVSTLILRIIFLRIGIFHNGEYHSAWYVYLLLGGFCSLMTLYKMYNPSKEVFTNIDHHTLKFVGYQSQSDMACLIDGRKNPQLRPLFNIPGINGFAVLKGKKDGIVVRQNLCQPVYSKSNSRPVLLNAGNLPFFHKEFTLIFHNGTGLKIHLQEQVPNDSIKRFHSSINVEYVMDGNTVEHFRGSFSRFIRRSFPLADMLSDVPVPEEFPLEWSVLRGISVVRENAGLAPEKLVGSGFHLTFDSGTLQSINTITTDAGSHKPGDLQQTYEINIPADTYISIGSGQAATPYIKPVMASNGKIGLELETQIKHLLPYEKDSLNQYQTVIVTSDLQSMAEAYTTSALYYPVFSQFNEKQQFRFALEYLPEQTRVPLVCKMQLYDNETTNSLTARKDGTYLLTAGNRIVLSRVGRYLDPVFQLQDFRSSVPFQSTKGYMLILFVLFAAGISLAAGQGKVETRGETVLWLGLLVLMTYRAFIAWRTSVFPPLEGITESRFMGSSSSLLGMDNSYLSIGYTFWMTIIITSLFILLPSLIYKLFYIPKGRKAFTSIRKYTWVKGWLEYSLMPVLSVLIVGAGLVAGITSERLAYIFFPVAAFFICEWLYHDKAFNKGESIDYRWKLGRYTAMLVALAIPMALDTGFGIVFVLFLLLYNALDSLYFLKFQTDFKEKDKLSMFNRRVRFILMLSMVVMFILLMVSGPRVVSLMYHNFYLIAGIILAVLLAFAWLYLSISQKGGYNRVSRFLPVGCAALFYIIFLIGGNEILHDHRHFLYRSEIHIKDVDEIMMDNEFGSRDLERLFEASQNRWYLGYYLKDRSWDQAVPFGKAYDLRSHFNKGVSWDTQKTDVVVSRYVIGEHSIWAVYSLIVLFILLFTGIYVSTRGQNKFTLLGCGAILLLLCQSLFIMMAVTNRFIFFGQDFPLLSQHSILTILLTTGLFSIAILSTLQPVRCTEDTRGYNVPDKRSIGILTGVFLLVVLMDPSLSGSDRSFNVAGAFKQTRAEMEDVNELLETYQHSNRNKLASEGIVQHFKTDAQLEKEKDQTEHKPKKLQSDYSRFIQMFDTELALGDTLANRAKRGGGVSRFTASLYRIYRDKLSKENRPSDIIHLKANQAGILQFGFSNSYYLLTTPESDKHVWTGDILPSEKGERTSVLSVQSPKGKGSIPFKKGAERLDRNKLLSYDFPIYLAKTANHWTVDGEPAFITRASGIPFTVKNGATAYKMPKAGANAFYMVLQNDDCIETVKDKYVGNQGGNIYVKGDVGRYFARNMLVNGKRELVYPLGEKLFYPYHVSQLAKAVYSGTDEERRKTDVHLALSYSLTEKVYDDMNRFTGTYYEPYARGVIVADGDGKIKAMATVKNPNRNSGYIRVSPNDENQISKLTQQYYLFGDNMAEEYTFGDMNLNYMKPGPGSSIKPITFTSVASQVCYDWRKLQLYVNRGEQNITLSGKTVLSRRYSSIKKKFPSPWNDEQGEGGKGYTDIRQYMKRSSNYYNSLMVFMGFYQADFLRKQLAYVTLGKESPLFVPYKEGSDLSFPAFTLRVVDHTRKFNFRQYVTADKMGIHKDGVLAEGFEKNFGLFRNFPQNLPSYMKEQSRDILEFPGVEPDNYYANYAYAFNRVSFLPDDERTTFQGAKDAITNTSLGASPFAVTPLKMAEMFGRLFSHDRSFRLTLNPDAETGEPVPFDIDPLYKKSGDLYEDILGNFLFEGMNRVVNEQGTAGRLSSITQELRRQGYYLYGKTGTISRIGGRESQLLGLVISKEKLHGLENPGEIWDLMKRNRFYVLYFSNAGGYHDYPLIRNTIKSVIGSSEFRAYMDGENENQND